MVKIAIAGGAGNVGQEIIDALVATGKHEIKILTRSEPPAEPSTTNIKYLKADYSSVDNLVELLRGTHTVLSFISVAPSDQDLAVTVQKNIIDACIIAGIKRFAPSEWGSSTFANLPWYSYKSTTRDYLASLNAEKKVLEYCLFQPGLFTNYLVAPYKSAKHLTMFSTPYDFNLRRMLVVDGGEGNMITLTAVQDLAKVVVKAVEYDGVWPVDGGMVGSKVSIGELVGLGERVRGGKFDITKLKEEDLRKGIVESKWLPRTEHPSIPPEHWDAASKAIVPGILLAVKDGAFVSSDTWNKLLPNFDFQDAETFLEREWKGRA